MQIPAKYLFYILFLGLVIVDVFFPQKNFLLFGRKDYIEAAFFIFLSITVVIAEWAVIIRCFKTAEKNRFFYTAIVLFPIMFLFFGNSHLPQRQPVIIQVGIILLTQFCFLLVLSENEKFFSFLSRPEKALFLLCGLYVMIFAVLAIRQYNYFSNFNPKDLAIYNQTFWNTIHGRIFQNSAYGSNFACHNSPFFFLLVPFYYFFPHPVTLLFLKTILLALSVVPLYFIIRGIINEKEVILPLVCAYLFYPHLISQNFTPAHEIAYAPFFLLSAFYFYQRKCFWFFAAFLLVSLFIKEHIALISVMFGVYALLEKRSKRWSITPMALGLFWGIFSLWIIGHFQGVYHSDIDAAWFIVDLKRRFLENEGNFAVSFVTAFFSSNIWQWYTLKYVFLFFSCLGIFLPFLSLEILIGAPELLLALLSNRSVMLSVPWHYTIAFSCFIFISAITGVKRISEWMSLKRFLISPASIRILLSITLFSLTLMQSYVWIDLSRIKMTKDEAAVIKKALAYVPEGAFITVPRAVAVFISSRKKYTLLEESRGDYGDYVLIDQRSAVTQFPQSEKIESYEQLFNNSGIILFKRKPD